MRYAATAPTAMILPLPVALPAREDAVRFKSLREFPDLFTSLEKGFPALEHSGGFLSRSKSASAIAAAPLAVHDVGDFVASFVPTVADFARIDARFVLSPHLWAKIPAYKDYGFAVFQLKELSGSPHPLAFEFDTRFEATVFFPTVHIHDGTVHAQDDFDHALYMQSAAYDAHASEYAGPAHVDKRTGFVRSKDRASAFAEPARTAGLVDPALLVHKVTLQGTLPNRDTLYDVSANANASGCGRCDSAGSGLGTTSIPLGLTLAGLAWVLHRRNALRR